MKKNKFLILCSLFFLMISLVFWTTCKAKDTKSDKSETEAGKGSAEEKTVMIVQSYGEGQGCGARIEEGLVAELIKQGYEEGKNLKLLRFYMDTQTKYVTPEAVEKRAKTAIEEIKKNKPDVIITLDDTAFAKVALKLVNTEHKIVFGGVNVSPENYNKKTKFMNTRKKPGFNITGVTEESRSDKGANVLHEIVPSAKNMAIISSSRGAFWKTIAEETIADMKNNPNKYPFKLVAHKLVDNFVDYKAAITEYNGRDDIDVIYNYGMTQFLDAPGSKNVVEVGKIFNWMLKNQTKPTFTWLMGWVKFGFLCGSGIDLIMSGEEVASQAISIMEGKDVGSIPIERPKDFYIAINTARADQLGIKIPAGIMKASRKIHTSMDKYPEYKIKGK